MKAVQIHEHGGVDRLCYEDVREPQINSPTEVIVRLKAAALNRADIEVRRGAAGVESALPLILGSDGAGTVVAIGSQVTDLRVGDDICLYPVNGCGGCEFCATDREFICLRRRVLGGGAKGTYAEYIRVPARDCFPVPRGFTFAEAAAFPLAFSAAWRMLVTNAEIKAGESLLIMGIGGGIATAALQIAVAVGARVIVASRSETKLTAAIRHGAEHGVDSQTSDIAKRVRELTRKRGVDVVVDCIGGESWSQSLASLAKGGRLVTCGAMAGAHPQSDVRRLFWNHLKIFGSTLGTRREFADILNFIKISGAKPILDKSFRLKDAALAQQRLEDGKQFGKIVLCNDA